MENNNFKTPWISISDMMTGLMMVFLLITVSYSHIIKSESESVTEKNENIQEIVEDIIDYRAIILSSLHREFDKDLEKWDASINDENLSFKFESPEVLFEPGSDEVTPLFEKILSDFWPRYINILSSHKERIDEIKIEGHTSSEWEQSSNFEYSYFKNMELSQNRARNVLEFCYSKTITAHQKWSISIITANGFSFSRLIYDKNGNENKDLSRRVEFTIHVDASKSISRISENF